jgi:ATP:ADP antiporter, AAA family
MIKALLGILNVVEGEEKRVLYLLGYGFFMGVFLAAYKIVATTLFLNNLSHYLREAFFISGLLGIVSTWLYGLMQNRAKFSRLIVFNILTVLVFIIAAKGLYAFFDTDWLIFILFVMLGPITSLLVLGFWGIFLRLFDPRQTKRIIGGIDSGQLIAIIITTFSIPFIMPYVNDITNLLIVGVVGLGISVLFFGAISRKFHMTSTTKQDKEIREQTRFTKIFSDKYVIYLSTFLFLSMSAFVFVDFSFMNVTEQQYPDEKQLASFLGVFEGSIMILSLLMQTLANEKILTMYGIKTSLFLLPVILFIFTILALASAYLFGFDVSSPEFIWFFLFVALSKLFITTLRESTENPVFKLFFMPIDSRIRFDVQIKVEGTVNELSRALAGGLIFLLGFLPFINLVHYTWILIAIIIAWSYMIVKIYHLYRENVKMKLERQKEEADKVEQRGKTLLLSRLFDSIEGQNPSLMIFALRALSKIAPELFKKRIDTIKNDHSIDVTNKVLQTLEGDFSFLHVASLKRIESQKKEGRKKKEQDKYSFEEEITEMINSANPSERKLAAELISATEMSENTTPLIELINDTDTSVVIAAMKSAADLKKPELLIFICDNLQKPKVKDAAIDALVVYGELAFPNLEKLFENSERNVDIKNEIIGIYGKVGGEAAREFLWDKIDYPDKKVTTQVLLSLSHSGFRANGSQIARIKQFIDEDVATLVWNLRAINSLTHKDSDYYADIIESLREENEHYYSHLFMLLSMIYDQKSIQLVKENIDSGTRDGVAYGVELLDVFLAEDLKQQIIPLLDDIADIDKIRRLEMLYPAIEMSESELVRMIINKEFSQVNRWSKALSLYGIGKNRRETDFNMELIANLFNPDLLLKEVCAWSMHQIDPEFFKLQTERLIPSEKDHLRNIILGQHKDFTSPIRPNMRFEIVNFLREKTHLLKLPYYVLASIVDFMEDVYLEGNTQIAPSDWKNDCFYIVYHGLLEVRDKDNILIDRFEQGSFLGEQINIDLLDEEVSFVADEDTVLLRIEKNKFLELITNEYDVTIKLLESLNTRSEISVN